MKKTAHSERPASCTKQNSTEQGSKPATRPRTELAII